ncbi:ABC transporter substrate-binding protein [Nesterenkonia aerolata]|uniref:ABC transporter substrate-binding protein n=1 Tax=Nesterenkonia aerolata TaxID=3074079 RepID=A0ABU2DR38_9MICC|nr:ABC transporter substrate-binding protein [Nesterenkonia sp. LY-0111]MDR8018775.1 ABC transporter substrate-binding protein [Nesterenkonia sp. LY-0111]
MLHRRHLSIVAGLSALGLALSSCGGGAEDGDQVSIDFYYPIAVGGPLEETIDGYIEQFEEENSHIDVTAVYSGDYDQTLASVQSASQAGNMPALSVLLSTDLLTLDDSDLIRPIGEITDDEDWLNSFEEAFMVNSTLPDGTVASIPFQRSTIVMYWNKELFEEAGLDPETAPETWDEMVEFGQQVQQDGGAQWGVQIPSTGHAIWMLEAMAIQNGVVLDDETGTETHFDEDGVVTALENWVELKEEGIEPEGLVDWGNLPNEFANGDTGIVWTTTGNLTNIRENADFDFGVAPLPTQEQPGSPTGGGNLYVMEGLSEEEEEAAVELAQFLSSPEIQADWGVASGYVATREDAWETEPLAEYVEDFPQAEVAKDQLPDAEREFGTFRRQEVGDFATNAVQSALSDGADPRAELEEAQEQADSTLDEYR